MSLPTGIRTFLRARFTRASTVGLYLTVGFLVCALAVVLFGTLARLVFHAEGFDIDKQVTLAIRKFHSPGHDRILQAITQLGDLWVLGPGTVLVTAGLWRKGHRVSALLFAGSVLGGFALNLLLKWVFERARPDLWPPLVTHRTYAFPSGHAAMATVFYGGATAVVFHLSRRPGVRLASFLASAAIIAAVAISRVYLGAHWLTDVLAGILVGLFWVTVAATGTEFFARRRAPAGSSSVGPPPTR